MNSLFRLAVISALSMYLAMPAYAQSCSRCLDDTLHNQHFNPEDPTVLFSSQPPIHSIALPGGCEIIHSPATACGGSALTVDALTVLSAAEFVDEAFASSLVARFPLRLHINRDRGALQVRSCDGREVVGHLPLIPDGAAAKEPGGRRWGFLGSWTK